MLQAQTVITASTRPTGSVFGHKIIVPITLAVLHKKFHSLCMLLLHASLTTPTIQSTGHY